MELRNDQPIVLIQTDTKSRQASAIKLSHSSNLSKAFTGQKKPVLLFLPRLLPSIIEGELDSQYLPRNIWDLLTYARKAWDVEVAPHKESGIPASSILAVAYNGLAQAWACHREWDKALTLLEQSRNIRESLGLTKDKLFSPLYHKALVLLHQAKYDEAGDVVNEAIHHREEAFGAEDTSSVRSGSSQCKSIDILITSGRSAALFYA